CQNSKDRDLSSTMAARSTAATASSVRINPYINPSSCNLVINTSPLEGSETPLMQSITPLEHEVRNSPSNPYSLSPIP
ncbi:MAG: hypothetical protein J6X16_02890, partial [Bacteroidales bacterium]|nr:hypothetical protein [Bacteroidales bacterium]